jgi:transposase
MFEDKNIILVVDYHLKNIEVRRLNCATGEERTFNCPTDRKVILALVDRTCKEAAAAGGKVVWIMESTTGWARVQEMLKDRTTFLLCNVLQMPLPPKGYRRKTDKIDTARMLREHLNGKLPRAYQPPRWLRELRRVVALRENLVNRRTEVRNWVTSYLSHETWESTKGLWTKAGKVQLERLIKAGGLDAFCIQIRIEELDHLAKLISQVEAQLMDLYKQCPQAQRLDRIRGIGPIGAICMWARIGPAERFGNAEQLIGYTGLSPGVRTSDDTRRNGHIGGGGTDVLLRRLIIESSIWARQIPRYTKTYNRVLAKRGKKVVRLVVCRLLLRGIYKVLRDGVEFNPAGSAAA